MQNQFRDLKLGDSVMVHFESVPNYTTKITKFLKTCFVTQDDRRWRYDGTLKRSSSAFTESRWTVSKLTEENLEELKKRLKLRNMVRKTMAWLKTATFADYPTVCTLYDTIKDSE